MKAAAPNPTGIRFTAEDKKILEALRRKLGIKPSEIVRLAIRRLAEAEHVGTFSASASRSADVTLESMYGVGRDLFRSLGGGENFIKAERAAFAASVRPMDELPSRKK